MTTLSSKFHSPIPIISSLTDEKLNDVQMTNVYFVYKKNFKGIRFDDGCWQHPSLRKTLTFIFFKKNFKGIRFDDGCCQHGHLKHLDDECKSIKPLETNSRGVRDTRVVSEKGLFKLMLWQTNKNFLLRTWMLRKFNIWPGQRPYWVRASHHHKNIGSWHWDEEKGVFGRIIRDISDYRTMVEGVDSELAPEYKVVPGPRKFTCSLLVPLKSVSSVPKILRSTIIKEERLINEK